MPRIILYKTPPPSQQPDPYLHRFEKAGYETEYIPVLKEEHLVDGLSNLLSRPGDTDGWAGVVITSKRGAEGWVKAAETSVPVSDGNERDDHVDWGQVPLFTVGATSLDHLAAYQNSLAPNLRLRTQDATTSKSAIELLPSLLSHRRSGRYLVIRGDKSTNELQDGLSGAGRTYQEMEVYTTSPRSDLVGNVQQAIRGNKDQHEDDGKGQKREIWMAFFSPSSAGIVLPILGDQLVQYSIAAIGSTTESYLRGRGVEVRAVAEQPTADGLLDAIQNARKGYAGG